MSGLARRRRSWIESRDRASLGWCRPRPRVAAFVGERQRSTAALASTSWLLRSLSGDGVDGDRVIAIVALRSLARERVTRAIAIVSSSSARPVVRVSSPVEPAVCAQGVAGDCSVDR